MNNLRALSYEYRKDVVNMIISGGGGHIGGDMSEMEILMQLYFKEMNISPENQDDPNRDYFILSKGHAVESYYTVLAHKGFFSLEECINTFSKFGSKFIGHPNNKIPGIEMNSGSLGHGLPVAVGLAIGAKMDKRDSRVYVLMGDGELAEGSVWEGAMSGGNYKLDNLCAIVDRNRLQISGNTENVMKQDDQVTRWNAFGWNAIECDGNSFEELEKAFAAARQCKGAPTVIIADTIKGKGSPVMEDKAGWHHHLPNKEEYEQIMRDLEERREAALNE